MDNNIFEKLSNQMTVTIESALSLALQNKNNEVDILIKCSNKYGYDLSTMILNGLLDKGITSSINSKNIKK